jgi:hypothetical protein
LRFTLVSRAYYCFGVLDWLFFVAARFWLDHLVLLLATRRALTGVCVAARFWLDHLVLPLFLATRRTPTGVFLFVGHFVCHVQPFSIVVTVPYYLLGLAVSSMHATGSTKLSQFKPIWIVLFVL